MLGAFAFRERMIAECPMGYLVNVDNGGTFTDLCVVDGAKVYHTKTLTTPHDLSKCFFEGLQKISAIIFDDEDLSRLLQNTAHLRYSTTQGTNALVERKGPRLGLILSDGEDATFLLQDADENRRELFEALVGDRVATVDVTLSGGDLEAVVVKAVNALTSSGANRLVVAATGEGYANVERELKRLILRMFPRHLLGAVPVLYSHEIAEDADKVRRTWTAIFDSFLHPAMERFLYAAEHKLRAGKVSSPLLIFRNDGDSARVAKTIAIKTYSSGPRGGAEGARALARHYGIDHLMAIDVGGTSTDIGVVVADRIRGKRRGEVERTPVSFPLSDIVSMGVGGSSVIRTEGGEIVVGPESMGASPGPACFGRGGSEATITDVYLLLGILDPQAFFGSALALDPKRSTDAVLRRVAEPLGLPLEEALAAMEDAWVARIVQSLTHIDKEQQEFTLMAFGGAGPLAICSIAEQVGVQQVLIPRLAAVFGAYGISFSDIAHHYETALCDHSETELGRAMEQARARAKKDMFAEGFSLDECDLDFTLIRSGDGAEDMFPLNGTPSLPSDIQSTDRLSLALSVTKRIPHPALPEPVADGEQQCLASGTRTMHLKGTGQVDVPVYRVEEQKAGTVGSGPAILQADYFTCRVLEGWRFEFTGTKDIMLKRMA